jgi:HEAT repeat protein
MSTAAPFRIFLSSPGDVADERRLALAVIESLQLDPLLNGRLELQPVAWEQANSRVAMEASLTPQEAINQGLPRPAECDLVLVIFWARMGTPLPNEYTKPDGSGYHSGTEYEFEDAMLARQEHGDRPRIWLYRRTEMPLVALNDPEYDDKLEQFQRVESFFHQFTDHATGALTGGVNHYESPDDFAGQLEGHLKHLFVRLLEDRPVSRQSRPASWQGSPFPGLRAFGEEDAPIFFGRDAEVYALAQRLQASSQHLVAVVGASGSGKSSLVHAGLIPHLKSTGEWQVWRLTPDLVGSRDPFAAFASALGRPIARQVSDNPDMLAVVLREEQAKRDKRLLVFIDQFEELFTTIDPGWRVPLLAALEASTGQPDIYFVLTLRGDFYGHAIAFPQLANLLKTNTYPLAAPTALTLHKMISRPAALAGLQFEDGLEDRIIEDMGDEPGALPLMAYTLDELYHAGHESGLLSHATYEALGGVHGAIGQRSEMVYADLDEAAQAALARVFRELVAVDDKGTATRQRAPLERVIGDDEAAARLVNALTEARLLVQSRGEGDAAYVEVAHEALLTSWERLAGWIQTVSEDLRLLRQVRLAAREWHAAERPAYFLWQHERLQPVYAMQERLGVAFDEIEAAFTQPEAERLMDEFRSDETPDYRRQTIIDRLAHIGDSSVPLLIEALDYAGENAQENVYAAFKVFSESSQPALIEAVEHGDPGTRLNCIIALSRVGSAEAVPVLLAAIEDPDPNISQQAGLALQAVADQSALPALTGALEREHPAVRRNVIEALRRIASPASLPALTPLLLDTEADIRAQAAGALRALPELPSPVREFVDLQGPGTTVIRAALGRLEKLADPAAVPHVVKALSYPDDHIQRQAVIVLGKLGHPDAVPDLIERLEDDWYVAEAAVRALGQIGLPESMPAIVDLLADDRMSVREAAHEALLNADESITVEIIDALDHHLGVVRVNAARLLGHKQSEDARYALIQALHDELPDVRSAAIEALASSEDVGLGIYLLNLLYDNDDMVVVTAVEAVLRLVHRIDRRQWSTRGLPQEGPGNPAALLQFVAGKYQVLVKHNPLLQGRWLGSTVTDSLSRLTVNLRSLGEGLEDSDPDVRRAVAVALGLSGEEAAVRPLIGAINDQDDYVRRNVATAFGLLGETRSVKALIKYLEDDSGLVRLAALRSLILLRDPAAITPLLRYLYLPDGTVDHVIVEALAGMAHPKAVHPLLEALPRASHFSQRMIVQALGEIADAAAVPALLEHMETVDEDILMEIVRTLAKIGEPAAIPALLRLMRFGAPDLENEIMLAIGSISPAAFEKVREHRKAYPFHQ